MSRQIEAGIPESWFRPLLKSNTDVPQGFWAMTVRVAPHFFGSILSGELTSTQAFNSNLSPDQTREMIDEGNRLHQKFNVKREVTESAIDGTWGRTMSWLGDGALPLLRWKNAETGDPLTGHIRNEALSRTSAGKNVMNPEMVAQFCDQFKLLRNDPLQRAKLESFVRMTTAAQRAFDFESSKRAVDRHIDLALNDPTYFICSGEALTPLNENIAKVAEEEAAILQKEQGIKIPDDVVRWFDF